MYEQTMMDETGSRGLLRIEFDRIAGEGKILPIILVIGKMSTCSNEFAVIPVNVSVKLKLGNETIGQGGLRECGRVINSYGRQIIFEVQTNQRALNFIDERFREDYLEFSLAFDTLMQVTRDQLTTIVKPPSCALSFQISKLDWLKQVLQPMQYADFAFLELPIPEVPNREQWTKALNHVGEAEAQFRTGNDPGVFSCCYAAYEAIQPIKTHLESVTNEDKRNAIKSIFDDMRRFYNKGRHIERTGADSGKFPVDHRDAEFAIYLTKSSVAYLAKLVHKV